MAETINFPDINTELTSGFWSWVKYLFGSRNQRIRRHGREAEIVVSLILEKKLPYDFLVVNNYPIPTSQGIKDVDHLVIGPTGIFCIDTKAETGSITISENGEFYRTKNGYPRDSKKHHKQVNGNVNILRGIFNREKLKGYIVPMLCFTAANVDLEEVSGVEIVYPGTLVESILKQRLKAKPADKKSYKAFFLEELARMEKTR